MRLWAWVPCSFFVRISTAIVIYCDSNGVLECPANVCENRTQDSPLIITVSNTLYTCLCLSHSAMSASLWLPVQFPCPANVCENTTQDSPLIITVSNTLYTCWCLSHCAKIAALWSPVKFQIDLKDRFHAQEMYNHCFCLCSSLGISTFV